MIFPNPSCRPHSLPSNIEMRVCNPSCLLQAWRTDHLPRRGTFWRRPKIHSGFSKAWRNNGLNDTIFNKLKELFTSGQVDRLNYRVYVTGLTLLPPSITWDALYMQGMVSLVQRRITWPDACRGSIKYPCHPFLERIGFTQASRYSSVQHFLSVSYCLRKTHLQFCWEQLCSKYSAGKSWSCRPWRLWNCSSNNALHKYSGLICTAHFAAPIFFLLFLSFVSFHLFLSSRPFVWRLLSYNL